MIVTKAEPPFSGNDIYLSYHSRNYQDAPLNDVIAYAGRDYRPVCWKLKDYYPGYALERGKVTVVRTHW